MSKERKYISIINNLISGLGLIILGVIIVIGSINLYTFVVNLLVYCFIIFGLSKLVNFLLNRKIVKNTQTIILIVASIVLGIVLLIFPRIQLSIIPISFSIYLFLIAIVKFINYMILKGANVRSRFKDLLLCIVFAMVSFAFLFYPIVRLNIFIMIIGIYCILLGLSTLYEFLIDILSSKTKLNIQRKIKMTEPAFLDAFFPKRNLKKINMNIKKIANGDVNNNNKYLKLLIHLSNYSVNQFGHIDIIVDKKIYSYGNYDRDSRKLFNGLGDGVLFIATDKSRYINFCLNNNKETIVEYGIELTENQEKGVKSKLDYIIKDTYEWYPSIAKDKNIKKLYYADKLYKKAKVKFYKFEDSEFKTFFIAGINCTYFINEILRDGIFQKLKVAGILSPGTYYEYLESNYNKSNSNVKYRKIYRMGDENDKN